jgi:hypothetical protein
MRMFAIKFKIDQMKRITLVSSFCIPLALFSQWTFKTVDNGFDAPYKIAHTAVNNEAILKLEPVEAEVALPKKYPQQSGMHVFETTYEHSLSGGESVDLTNGILKNTMNIFSGEMVVIAGQTTINIDGNTKKYFLLFDGINKLYCGQEKIKFTIPTSIEEFNLQNESEIDSLIQIAKNIRTQCLNVPQLYEKRIQISFYLTGGYHCDDEIPVDISFMVGGQYQKFSVNGMKSQNSATVFLVNDLNTSELKDAFFKASSIKLRFNESHCESDYYEFKMTGSTAAFNFVGKL